MTQGEIALFVDDMFFGAKIAGAAQAAGREVKRFRSLAQLEEHLEGSRPQLVIIDLNSDRHDAVELIRLLKSKSGLRAIPLIGFVSHVQVDLIRNAKEAGCDYVLPRSAFNRMLADIMGGNLRQLEGGDEA